MASADETSVHRGTLEAHLLLSGELEAERSAALPVPLTPNWQVQIRWLAADGAAVAAGERVIEFDNSDLARSLEDQRLAASRAREELASVIAKAQQTAAEKTFAVEEAQAKLATAELDASAAAGLLSAREAQNRELARAKAQVGLEKAAEERTAEARRAAADRAIAEIGLEKAARALERAESGIDALALEAPRAGIFVVENHPWEGRKIQVGDAVWPGIAVGSLPDLTSLRVRAALFDVDRARLAPGMAAHCTLDAFPREPIPCRVVAVSPVAREPEARSLRRVFPTWLSLERIDPERMRPGQSVKVEIVVDRRENVLLAPRAALDVETEPPRARLADGARRAVRLGPCDAQECVVEEGLAEGERLLTADRF